MRKINFIAILFFLGIKNLNAQMSHQDSMALILVQAKNKPSQTQDNSLISKKFVGKKIGSWQIQEVQSITQIVNTNSAEPKYNSLFPKTNWFTNFDYDPFRGNIIVDSALLRVTLKLFQSGSSEIFTRKFVDANHTYNPTIKLWKTNLVFNKTLLNKSNEPFFIKIINSEWVSIPRSNYNFFKVNSFRTTSKIKDNYSPQDYFGFAIAYKECEACPIKQVSEGDIVNISSVVKTFYVKRIDKLKDKDLYFEMYFGDSNQMPENFNFEIIDFISNIKKE